MQKFAEFVILTGYPQVLETWKSPGISKKVFRSWKSPGI
jgi:hypothetical protein